MPKPNADKTAQDPVQTAKRSFANQDQSKLAGDRILDRKFSK
jgi:hypothetical protein